METVCEPCLCRLTKSLSWSLVAGLKTAGSGSCDVMALLLLCALAPGSQLEARQRAWRVAAGRHPSLAATGYLRYPQATHDTTRHDTTRRHARPSWSIQRLVAKLTTVRFPREQPHVLSTHSGRQSGPLLACVWAPLAPLPKAQFTGPRGPAPTRPFRPAARRHYSVLAPC